MKVTHLFMALLATALLASCSSKPSDSLQKSIDTEGAYSSTFDPSNSVIPFPDDLLFQGSADGTLNIPVADPTDLSDPQVALNALDGFSTNAPITAGFTGPIDPASVTASAVRVFEVSLSSTPGGAVVNLNAELTFGVDFYATVSSIDPNQMVILPLKPLKPETSYQVVITHALMGTNGKSMQPSVTYALVKSDTPFTSIPADQLPLALSSLSAADFASIEGLRQLISASEGTTVAMASPALTKADIILSWSFTTESIGNVLVTVKSTVTTPATSMSPFTTNLFGTGPGKTPKGLANIFTGTIDVPYYLTVSTSANDPTAINSHWVAANPAFSGDTEKNLTRYNPLPEATKTVSIPIMVTTPVGTSPPWKTVIFQHGITSNRTSMLGIADSLAQAGFAVVAIDLPMHGVDSSSPFYSAGNERTFDLDLVTQDPTTGAVTAYAHDGVTDTSGTSFINLQNLLNTRDNVRQAVADLFEVTAAIGSINVAGGTNLDPNNIYFVGHSLGAIVGTPFLALEGSTIKAAVLANGGSEVAKILDGSASFGSVIANGLAANGVNKGTSDYEAFLAAAQTVVDSGDPVNYSLDAGFPYAPSAAAGRGLLFFEVVGDSVLGNPSDLVVPNIVPDSNDASGTIPAPLAGTEPQLALLGLTQVSTPQSGSNLLLTTKYTSGDHSSLLDPTSDVAVTTEMQKEIANFLGSDGAALVVTDSSVLQATP